MRLTSATSPPRDATSTKGAALSSRVDQMALQVAMQLKAQDDRLREHRAAMDVQYTHLVGSLETERATCRVLKEQVKEQNAKMEKLALTLTTQAAETERLREELAEKRRGDAELRQKVRMKEEAAASARSKEEDERRGAVSGVLEQVRALSDVVSDHERSAKADAESLRAELNAHAQRLQVCEAEVAAMKQAHAAGMQKLTETLRWVDEDHMGRRAEGERSVASSIEILRNELTHGLASHREAVDAKIGSAAAATERLREELAERRRGDAELRQEVRMKEEAAARARSREEDERRGADSSLREQIHALSEVVSAAGRSAKADAEAVRSELAKHAASRETEVTAIKELVNAAGRSAKADADEIRSELAKHVASWGAAAAVTKDALAADLQRLDGGLRAWVAEAIAHAAAEEERRTAFSLEAVHGELASAIAELKAQVAEAVVPLGEPGALSTLRETLWRVDALGKVVARLCDHAAQYASTAEAQEIFRGYPHSFSPTLWPGMFVAARPRSPGRGPSPPRAAERQVAWASGTRW